MKELFQQKETWKEKGAEFSNINKIVKESLDKNRSNILNKEIFDNQIHQNERSNASHKKRGPKGKCSIYSQMKQNQAFLPFLS